jgi:hypothetical protein
MIWYFIIGVQVAIGMLSMARGKKGITSFWEQVFFLILVTCLWPYVLGFSIVDIDAKVLRLLKGK